MVKVSHFRTLQVVQNGTRSYRSGISLRKTISCQSLRLKMSSELFARVIRFPSPSIYTKQVKITVQPQPQLTWHILRVNHLFRRIGS